MQPNFERNQDHSFFLSISRIVHLIGYDLYLSSAMYDGILLSHVLKKINESKKTTGKIAKRKCQNK